MDQNYLKECLEKMDDRVALKDLQKYVNDMVEIRGFDNTTPQEVMLLLTEEIGELAKEVRKSTKMKIDVKRQKEIDVEGEIADVFIYILSMCRVMNINLIDAFKKKEQINLKREWK